MKAQLPKILAVMTPLLIVVLLPVIVGMMAKWEIDESFEIFESSAFVVEETKYDVGWRSSLVVHELAIPGPDRDVMVTLETSMLHGPYRDSQTGEWMWFSAETEVYLDGKPLYPSHVPPILRSRLKLDRTGFTLIDMPATEIPISGSDYIEFRGLVGMSSVDPDSGATQIRYHLKGMTFHIEDKLLDIRNLESTSTLLPVEDGLPLGSEVGSIDSISFRDFGLGTRFDIKDVDMVSESESRQGLVGGSARITADSIAADGNTFGPMAFKMIVNGLNEQAIVNANGAVRTIYGETKNHPKNRDSKLQHYFKNRGWMIFQGKPHVRFELTRFGLTEGDLIASLDLSVTDLEGKDFRNLALAIKKISSDVHVSVPKAVLVSGLVQHSHNVLSALNALPVSLPGVEQGQVRPGGAAAILKQALAANLITEEGGYLSTHVRFEGGALSANGQPLVGK